MLGLFKKKKEDSAMTEDEKQAAEAEAKMKERGEEDGTKDQTAQDVKDEIVGAEEKAAGDENSQSAKAREKESEGTKEYDEKKAEETREQAHDDLSEKIMARIDSKIEEAVSKAVAAAMAKVLDDMGRTPEQADKTVSNELEGIYGE